MINLFSQLIIIGLLGCLIVALPNSAIGSDVEQSTANLLNASSVLASKGFKRLSIRLTLDANRIAITSLKDRLEANSSENHAAMKEILRVLQSVSGAVVEHLENVKRFEENHRQVNPDQLKAADEYYRLSKYVLSHSPMMELVAERMGPDVAPSNSN